MGYQIFGKVKTIVLPIDDEKKYTFDEYKAKYGIDLRDFVKINNNYINFKAPKDSLILISDMHAFASLGYSLSPILNISQTNLLPDSKQKARTELYINTSGDFGIAFESYNYDELSLDKIYVLETDY